MFRFRRVLATGLFFILSHTLVRAGTFTNPQFIPTTYDPLGLAAADLNGDGNLDIVYVDGTGTYAVHVLLGKGDGTFSHGQDLSLPAGVCGPLRCPINAADVTHDGKLDLILGGSNPVSSTSTLATLTGNGDGTFGSAVVSTFQSSGNVISPDFTSRVGVGDVNGDGAADLVTHDDSTFRLDLFLGDNTGHFSLVTTTTTLNTRDATYLLDLNGDGHLDVISMDNLGAGFVVALGNGNGTFQQSVRYNTGTATGSLTLADLDGDGHPDVVGITYPESIVFIKGNADGTFAAPISVGNISPADNLVEISDFNNDSIVDLVFLTGTGVGVMPATGSLQYGPIVQTVSGASSALNMAVGDFNKDSHLDIAMGVEGGIVLLIGNGDGSFKSAKSFDMTQQVGAVAVADFNGDHLPDIAVSLSAPNPRLLLATGGGNFVLSPDTNSSYGSITPSPDMVTADFNGDGKADLADLSSSVFGSLQVFFGTGNGSFSQLAAVTNGSTLIADLNNDRRSDMVSISGSSIISFLGQVDGSFNSVSTHLRNPDFAYPLAVGDLNKDGKPDVVIASYSDMEVWLGNGDGSFSYFGSFGVSGQFITNGQTAVLADLDGDGNADLILAPSSDTEIASRPLEIFYGHGDGTFQPATMLVTSYRAENVTVADVNADNKPDLVVSDGLGISVILNLGSRNFDAEEHFVAGPAISNLAVADINGDGYPDIIAANPGGTTVALLLNDPNGTPPGGISAVDSFTVAPEPSNYGQSVTLTLTVSSPSSGSAAPTGSVNFSIDGGLVATVPLTGQSASFVISSPLAVGSHTVVATYNGDAMYHLQNLSKVHVVLPPVYATQTTIAAAPASVLLSQTVRLTATVTSSQPVVAGYVTFLDGTQSLGAERVDSAGVALFDTAELTGGTHSITATYHGLTSQLQIFSPSSSSAVAVTVNSTGTQTSLSSSSALLTAGTVVTFTARVSAASGAPFGGVTFYDGNQMLGTQSVKSDGSASYSVASLTTGSHTITAAFNSNATFAASTSPPVQVSVQAPIADAIPTFVSLTSIQPAGNGTSAAFIVHVNAIGGMSGGTVTILDNGNILGAAQCDDAGIATLQTTLGVGSHRLRASFAGTAQLSPSVSPELLEDWSASGPAFSLRVSPASMSLSGSEFQQGTVSVISSPGFHRRIQLSCQSLSADYSCVFSPASMAGSGTSSFSIRRNFASNVRRFLGQSRILCMPLAALTLLIAMSIFGNVPAFRSFNSPGSRALLLVAICISIGAMAACRLQNTSGTLVRPGVMVVTVQGVASDGSSSIIQSAQIALNISEAGLP